MICWVKIQNIFFSAATAEVLLVLPLFVPASSAVSVQLLWNHAVSQTVQLIWIQTPTVLGLGGLEENNLTVAT